MNEKRITKSEPQRGWNADGAQSYRMPCRGGVSPPETNDYGALKTGGETPPLRKIMRFFCRGRRPRRPIFRFYEHKKRAAKFAARGFHTVCVCFSGCRGRHPLPQNFKIFRRGDSRVKSNIVNKVCKDMVYT